MWTRRFAVDLAKNKPMNPDTLSKKQVKRAAHFLQAAQKLPSEQREAYIEKKLFARYPQLQNSAEQQKVIDKAERREGRNQEKDEAIRAFVKHVLQN